MNPSLGKIAARIPNPEPEIDWSDYLRFEPSTYRAYCRRAKPYYDRRFKRWTCLLLFDVVDASLNVIGHSVPMWLNLGPSDRPHAARSGRYFKEWILANGGPPKRKDRVSHKLFERRYAVVRICDTKGPAPYSKVDAIISWETGASSGSISQSVTQSSKGPVKPLDHNALQELNVKSLRPLPGSRYQSNHTPRGDNLSADMSPKGKRGGPLRSTLQEIPAGGTERR